MIRIVVVSYRNSATLPQLFDSLAHHWRTPAELIVWCNDRESRATTEAWQRQQPTFRPWTMRLEGAGENIGFAAACNAAARLPARDTEPTAFFFLNPDAHLVTPVTDDDVRALAAHRALVGIRVYNGDGRTVQASARSFPSLMTAVTGRQGLLTRLWPANPWSQKYLREDLARATGPTRVDWASGSGLFVPRDLWEKVGGFDEGYFLYVEDVDLGRQAAAQGVPVVYDPRIAIVHDIGGSREGKPSYRADLYHHRGMWRYHRKWSRGLARLLSPFIALGIVLRFCFRRVFG